MDEDEIDSLYEEQKELLMEEYLKALQTGVNKDKAKKAYTKKLTKAREVYTKRMDKHLYRVNHPPLHQKILARLKPKPKK